MSLRLITGKVRSGKTSYIIGEIREAVRKGTERSLLLVPEQYSHEAERELCAVCGDSLSLYGEVFSFTGLARRLMSELGGGAAPWLDKGGRLLCMALALANVAPRLRVYGAAAHKVELQALLLRELDELKTACVTPEQLERAAGLAGDSLGDKLFDLALITAAYDAVVANGRADPADRLSVLAAQIPQSSLGPQTAVYVDGFIDVGAVGDYQISVNLQRP
jgi:ATP-dependent helicase/nuclease subunit B